MVVLLSQALFSTSDIMGRYYMKRDGFNLASFLSIWFASYFLIRMLAMFGQLYALAHLELGRSQTLFGVSGLIIANLVGLFFLNENLGTVAYLGVLLAIIAFFIVGFGKV